MSAISNRFISSVTSIYSPFNKKFFVLNQKRKSKVSSVVYITKKKIFVNSLKTKQTQFNTLVLYNVIYLWSFRVHRKSLAQSQQHTLNIHFEKKKK